jgi:hypothetical protein
MEKQPRKGTINGSEAIYLAADCVSWMHLDELPYKQGGARAETLAKPRIAGA